MPFKTRYGTHYHSKQTCPTLQGRETMPCSKDGLEPCAICVSTGGRRWVEPGYAGGFAGTSSATGGMFSAEDAPEPGDKCVRSVGDDRSSEQAAPVGESPLASYLASVGAAPASSRGFAPDVGSLSNGDAPSIPVFSPPTGEAPRMPDPTSGTAGFRIDDNGEIVRVAEQAEKQGQEMAEKLDNVLAAQLGIGYETEGRDQVANAIDGRARSLPEGEEREAFRKGAQKAWNGMHPEAPVLEWSREDEGYVADSARSVLQRKRNYSEMRSLRAGGTTEVGYDYSIRSKATGEDITERVSRTKSEHKVVTAAIARIEENVLRRGKEEVAEQERGLFRDWMFEKQRTSRAWRYHSGPYDGAQLASLRHEFRFETGYVPPEPQMRPTEEERELMYDLNHRHAVAQRELDELVMDHDLTDEMVDAVIPHPLWVSGQLTGEPGYRFSA